MENKARKEDVIVFSDDEIAYMTRVQGDKIHMENWIEQSDCLDVITGAVDDDRLKKATKIENSKSVQYVFRFKNYDEKKKKDKTSAVRIVVPLHLYEEKNKHIKRLDRVVDCHHKVQMFKKGLAILTTAAVVFATPVVVKGISTAVDNMIEKDNERYEQQMENMEEKVEQLTGRTIEDIVNGDSDMDNLQQNQKLDDSSSLDEKIDEMILESVEQDEIRFGK